MKYFITYGNSDYEKSRERLINEARETKLFDYLKAYQPSDLPSEIISNPIFQYARGGGYWIWKPYIVRNMLSQMKENDILVYADAGCSIYKSTEWNKYFAEMKYYSILAFRIKFANIKYTKKDVIELFNSTNGKMWKHFYQIAATTFIIKKNKESLLFINEWENLCVQDLVLDVPPYY